MRPLILCPEPQNYSHKGLTTLQQFCRVDTEQLTVDELNERLPNYDGVMIRLQHRLPKSVLERCPKLKAILTPTTGRDHIDLLTAQALGIEVFSLFGFTDFLDGVYSSAEHSFALLLSLIRHVPQSFHAVLQNQWEQVPFRGRELYGLRIGIIGYGRIGKKVAHYAQAFGMQVRLYDPYITSHPTTMIRYTTLADMLPDCDVLSVHVPLNSDTHHMLGQRELNLLPSGSYLINTARGAVLDEEALLHALTNDHLRGAALDVLTGEDQISQGGHRLIEYARTHPNLIITPHIGGAAEEAIEKTDLFVIGQFQNWWEQTYPPSL